MTAIQPELSRNTALLRRRTKTVEPVKQHQVTVTDLPAFEGVKKIHHYVTAADVTYHHEIDPRRLDRVAMHQMLPWEQEYVCRDLDNIFTQRVMKTAAQASERAGDYVRANYTDKDRASVIDRTRKAETVGDAISGQTEQYTDTVKSIHYYDARDKSVITFSRAERKNKRLNRTDISYTFHIEWPNSKSMCFVMRTRASMPGMVSLVSGVADIERDAETEMPKKEVLTINHFKTLLAEVGFL